MRLTSIFKICIAMVILSLAMLACTINIGAETTEATLTPQVPVNASIPGESNTPIPQTNVPPVASDTQGGNSANPASLTQDLRTKLAHATVRIKGMHERGGELLDMYGGSGTILSPDGLILTNCHVANPALMGIELPATLDQLLVEIEDAEDLPPVPSYFAQVLAFDPMLDLAVIKVAITVDGKPASGLNLPYVPIGDSDKLNLGDPLFIFGFPGIGGDTITYTTGPVSGFDSEEPVGRRAWIKTSATIAGGNSGGLAANSMGEIIGVPTRVTTASGEGTDCRHIQDTNGDGVIDANDMCVPVGGYINGIRPVNWALPLIQAAKDGVAYQSPYPPMVEAGISETPSAGNLLFTLKAWSQTLTSDGCPASPVDSFPPGTKELNAVFSWNGLTNGEKITINWYYNQRNVASNSDNWQDGTAGECFPFTISNKGQILPTGEYMVAAYLGSNLVGKATTNVGNGPGSTGGVKFTGQIVDANTGQGVENIAIVLLKPGVTADSWLQNPVETDIYTGSFSGMDGYFELPDPLNRGETYEGIIGNAKIGYPPTTGSIQVAADSPDTITMKIQISK